MGFQAAAVQPVLKEQLAALIAANPPPLPTPVPAEPSTGAGNEPTPTPGAGSTGKVTYLDNLKAPFDNVCGSCHTGSSGMANLDLSTYQGILNGNSTGKGIIPGNLDGSLIYQKLLAGGHFGQFTAEQLDLLKSWILAGAPEK